MATEHPYRAALRAELNALTEEMLAKLDDGHEMPFDDDVIEAAGRATTYRRAERLAGSEGHRLTAWMLRRLTK